MATNEFLPFCPTDTGLNLLTQPVYAAAPDRNIGNQPGIASSKLNNKALRQSSAMTSQFAQFMADKTGINILDDGNLATLLSTITTALANPTNSNGLTNLGLLSSVGASALTIALKTQDGSTNASMVNPISIGFRSVTITSAEYLTRSVTAALSIVVPSGATLGHASAISTTIYVYAIDNAGVVELAVSSKAFDEGSVITTTAISAASTSATTIYSTVARTNVPLRLIGRLTSNQTVAGTWAAVPTESSLMRFGTYSGYTPWTAFTPTGSWVNNITYTGVYRRVGQNMEARVRWVMSGVGTNAEFAINLPLGLQMDTSYVLAQNTSDPFGNGIVLDTGNANFDVVVIYGGTTQVVVRAKLATGTYVGANSVFTNTVPFTWGNTDEGNIYFSVPIKGWA